MTLLRSVTLADGTVTDVALRGPRIAAVGPALGGDPGEEVLDLGGWLLLPAPVEPHAHLDKALTADLVDNPAGDLLGAVLAWEGACSTFTVDNVAERAKAALLRLVASGCTAVRSHVNVGGPSGMCNLEALLQVRAELGGTVDLQLIALVPAPTDPGVLREAVAMGVDGLGGAPHMNPDPVHAIETVVALAADYGLLVDLHTDETLDPGVLDLRDLARIVADAGMPGVAASHCVSLGVQEATVQAKVAEEVADAGISVITLPQTNLYLQARGLTSAPPRGLTALRPLLDAGVNVAGGADNLQDPFITVGRADPLETAALLVMAGHLTPTDAYTAVSDSARAALGLEPVRVEAGSPADLLAVRAASVRCAIADAPADRLVFCRGRLVARTASTQDVLFG